MIGRDLVGLALIASMRQARRISDATYTYREFMNDVEQAPVDRFGRAAVKRGGKAFDNRGCQSDCDRQERIFEHLCDIVDVA